MPSDSAADVLVLVLAASLVLVLPASATGALGAARMAARAAAVPGAGLVRACFTGLVRKSCAGAAGMGGTTLPVGVARVAGAVRAGGTFGGAGGGAGVVQAAGRAGDAGAVRAWHGRRGRRGTGRPLRRELACRPPARRAQPLGPAGAAMTARLTLTSRARTLRRAGLACCRGPGSGRGARVRRPDRRLPSGRPSGQADAARGVAVADATVPVTAAYLSLPGRG